MKQMDVIYNGSKQTYYSCSSPSDLIPFKHYIVKDAIDRGWQTDYELYGLPGRYNSVWFNPIEKQQVVFADHVPVVNERLDCGLIGTQKRIYTSKILYVEPISTEVYKITTKSNSMYIVRVIN